MKHNINHESPNSQQNEDLHETQQEDSESQESQDESSEISASVSPPPSSPELPEEPGILQEISYYQPDKELFLQAGFSEETIIAAIEEYCRRNPDLKPEIQKRVIEIKKFSSSSALDDLYELFYGNDHESLFLRKYCRVIRSQKYPLDFEISDEQIIKIVAQIKAIFNDPKRVLEYLQPLEEQLSQALAENNVEFKNCSAKYLIAAKGYFIAGPWQDGYVPAHKGKILQKILLQHENQFDINLGGTPIFYGYVSPRDAVMTALGGYIPAEYVQSRPILYHGKDPHRLAFEVLRQAIKKGDLNLEAIGGNITLAQLLALTMTVRITTPNLFNLRKNTSVEIQSENKDLIWNYLFDSYTENIISSFLDPQTKKWNPKAESHKNYFNPDYYSYSASSPNTFQSLLICFARQQLPSLSQYLLDSHYKQMAQMVYNAASKVDADLETIFHVLSCHTLENEFILPKSTFSIEANPEVRFNRFDKIQHQPSPYLCEGQVVTKKSDVELGYQRQDSNYKSLEDYVHRKYHLEAARGSEVAQRLLDQKRKEKEEEGDSPSKKVRIDQVLPVVKNDLDKEL